MRIHMKTVARGTTAILALSLLATAPSALAAQDAGAEQQVAADSAVGQEEMEHYVDLQLTIDSLQEEAIQEMVRIHSEEGRARIRNNLTEAIASAHEEHELTPDRYKTITFLISSDEAVRELFETTMTAVREGGTGESSGG